MTFPCLSVSLSAFNPRNLKWLRFLVHEDLHLYQGARCSHCNAYVIENARKFVSFEWRKPLSAIAYPVEQRCQCTFSGPDRVAQPSRLGDSVPRLGEPCKFKFCTCSIWLEHTHTHTLPPLSSLTNQSHIHKRGNGSEWR